MIMGIPAEDLQPGERVTLDFHEGKTIHAGVPVCVIRRATAEEWVRYKVDEEGFDEPSVRQGLARWLQIPLMTFYEVSVD